MMATVPSPRLVPGSPVLRGPGDRDGREVLVDIDPFVGRRAEVAALTELVAQRRLVSVTGPGGAGKTRLTREVVRRGQARFDGGIWWIGLAGVADPAQVAAEMCAATNAPVSGGDATEDLVARIGTSLTLLVFDNCEHVVDAVATVVGRLLASCAETWIVTTTRAPLEVPGEVVWQIPPMSVPPLGATVEAADDYDGISLFVARAQRAQSAFSASLHDLDVIGEICRRLDGIPLALELAAARCRSLTPSQIAASLGDAIPLLSTGSRAAVARQQTIERSIEWSYRLLESEEQATLRRLSVFAGPFNLADATAVLELTDREDPQLSVIDLVDRLVTRSLLQFDDGPGTYRLLETVRQFAHRRLTASGEAPSYERRHLDRLLDVLDGFAARFRSEESLDAIRLVETAHVEIRAALDRLAEHHNWDTYGRMLWPLSLHLASTARLRESLGWLDRHLDAVGDELTHAAIRSRCARGVSRVSAGDPVGAVGDLDAVLAAACAIQDDMTAGRAASGLAFLWALIDPNVAMGRIDEAAERLTRAGDAVGLAQLQTRLALVLQSRGRPAQAVEVLDRSGLLAAETPFGQQACAAWAMRGMTGVLHGRPATITACIDRIEAAPEEFRPAEYRFAVIFLRSMAAVYRGEPGWPTDVLDGHVRDAERCGQGVSTVLLRLAAGLRAHADGHLIEARERLVEVADVSAGIAFLVVFADLAVADVLHALGDGGAAGDRLTRSRRVAAPLSNPQFEARALRREAALCVDHDDLASADGLLARALAIDRQVDDQLGLVTTIELMASSARRRDDWTAAASLLGHAEVARAQHQVHMRLEPERSRTAADIVAIDDALGARADVARAVGTAATLDELVRPIMPSRRASRAVTGWESLTPAETEVVALVRDGLSNRQIAAHLDTSAETIKTHVSHILMKLNLANRTQIAVRAARRDNVPDGPT